MTIEVRIGVVRAAVEFVKACRTQFQEAERNPAATSLERGQAKIRWIQAEHEFGWQWQNVEEILNHFAPEARHA